MKEAQQLEIIERERAQERKKAGKKSTQRLQITAGKNGRTGDYAGIKTGIGKRNTYERALKIWKAKDKNPVIKEMVKKIDGGIMSIGRVYAHVQREEQKEKYQNKSKNPKKYTEKYKALLIDPPWKYANERDSDPRNGGQLTIQCQRKSWEPYR
jgi:hypothetical protein